MIPDIRRGVLCVEKAADCLEEFEQEALAAQHEEEKNKEVSLLIPQRVLVYNSYYLVYISYYLVYIYK